MAACRRLDALRQSAEFPDRTANRRLRRRQPLTLRDDRFAGTAPLRFSQASSSPLNLRVSASNQSTKARTSLRAIDRSETTM